MDLIEVAAIAGVSGSVLNLIGFAVMIQRYLILARETRVFAGEVLEYLRPEGEERGGFHYGSPFSCRVRDPVHPANVTVFSMWFYLSRTDIECRICGSLF